MVKIYCKNRQTGQEFAVEKEFYQAKEFARRCCYSNKIDIIRFNAEGLSIEGRNEIQYYINLKRK